MERRTKIAIAVLIMGLIAFFIWIISLRINHNALRIIGIMLGAFTIILNLDEKRNANHNPLLFVGVFSGSASAALLIIGIIQSFT